MIKNINGGQSITAKGVITGVKQGRTVVFYSQIFNSDKQTLSRPVEKTTAIATKVNADS